ncbi:amidase family protein [Jeotgalibaca sp. YN-L-12]|nr:amidase family protein [Jeotgalibaca caeni]MDE1549049.1 amidase family protein [Jeotgalibaca caeni]
MVVGPGNMRGWGGASTPFVLASSVRDTNSLLHLLEGKQPQAPYQIAPLLESDLWNELDFTTLRIGYTVHSPVGSTVSEDAIHAVESVIQLFQDQGAVVEEAAPEYDGVALMEAYYVMNGAETAAMMQKIARGMNRSLTPSDMEPMTWAIYQYGLKLSAADYIDAFAVWDQAAEVMTNYHQQYDLFLTPTTAEVAPLLSREYQSRELLRRLQAMDEGTSIIQAAQLVYEMFEKSLAVTPFTQLANLTGQPAISLPLYVNEEKLPLGVQLMAQKGQEPVLIQIAEFFENANLFRSAIE